MADVRNFKLPGVWAKNAYTTIPVPPVVNLAYRNENLSQEDIEQGQLFGALGNSADWNQMLWLLSALADEGQNQGILSWSPQIDYAVGAWVMGANGNAYTAMKASGPATEIVNPATEEESEDMTWLDVTTKLTTPVTPQYEICEFYDFRHPTARSGMVPRYGSLIQDAATLYPKAWAYLQTAEGQMLCKTEAEWQAMSTATYYTDASGNTEGWNGIGGVPFYVQDLGAGTLRVPDTRGMYKEDAGFDSLDVGTVKGPGLPNITGSIFPVAAGGNGTLAETSGAFLTTGTEPFVFSYGSMGYANGTTVSFSANTENKTYGASSVVSPRRFGILPCVYLGS